MKKAIALALSLLLVVGLVPMVLAEAEKSVLRVGVDTEPVGFDPHTISAVASLRIIKQMYNTLVDIDADLNVVPQLATSWEQPDDTTYVFKLREDVKFHNGRGMTAEDVKYSFERVLDPDLGALGNSDSYAGDVQAVNVIDDYTVEIKLSKPSGPFLSILSSGYLSIVCKEVIEENGDLLRADGGTGPYTLGEWVPDNMVTVHKFDDYFLEGKPVTDTIEFYTMTDSSARLAALRTGSVDLINADTAMLSLVEGEEDINTVSYQSVRYSTLCLNTNLPQFSDVRVRQAISLAIDREEIIDMAYNGEAEVSGFIPATLGHWAVDVTEHPMYQQDIEKAKALLAEAGYADGFEVTLIVGLMDSLRDIGAVVQQQLAEIGITVNVVNKESAEYIELWKAHDFEMMACENGAGSDPNRGVGYFFKTGQGPNIAEYSNARVDEICELGASTADVEMRRELYTEAIEIILDECPNVTIASPRDYFMASPKLEGFAPTALSSYLLEDAYIAK